MNIDTAMANMFMNSGTQNNPYGTISTEQTGWSEFVDSTGKTIRVPKFTQTTTLSPEQQAIFDSTNKAKGNLANLAADRSAFLQEYLAKPMDTSGLAPLRNEIGGDFSTKIGGNFSTEIGGNYSTDVRGLKYDYAGADDFSKDRQMYTDTLMERMAPDLAANRDDLRTTLINQGLRPGTAAWNSEMDRLSRSENDASMAAILAGGEEQARMVGLARDAAMFNNSTRMGEFGAENAASLGQAAFGNDASLQAANFGNNASLQAATFANNARAQGMGELFALRSQPINEITALMSGSQITNPTGQSQPMPQAGVAGVDYTGLVNQKYQADMANYQSGMGGLFGLGTAAIGLF